ncbi:hypothetical protein BDV93DRAFT_546984 [Ceratobasidium sp. AG-I]|nr:hypothetical protein BDV93DRAFT_546984 [Ceratobasidium sp. AG-I]
MALAGGSARCYSFVLVITLLSALYSIVHLALSLQPQSFTPTPISSKYETQSRPSVNHEGELPIQHPNLLAPRVYMITLPRRADRRKRMMKLQAVTGLSWTFVDATDSTAEIVGRIIERIRWSRASVYLHAIDASFIGWWSDHQDEELHSDAKPKGSELWELPSSEPTSADYVHPLPVPALPDQRPALEAAAGNTIPRLGSVRASGQAVKLIQDLSPNEDTGSSRPATRVATSTFEPRLTQLPYWRVLTRGTIACWHSHLGVIRAVASEETQTETTDAGVIILEDDIDMELDIQLRISRLWEALPPDWDILFLGHCWSAENTRPPLRSHSALHRSHSPKCTHAYALSYRGARRVAELLREPLMAYSRPLDAAYLELIQSNQLNAYSVYPSVIVQTKDSPSDIFPGNGSRWKDVLWNSALARADALGM